MARLYQKTLKHLKSAHFYVRVNAAMAVGALDALLVKKKVPKEADLSRLRREAVSAMEAILRKGAGWRKEYVEKAMKQLQGETVR